MAVLKAQGRRWEAVRELSQYLETFINDNEAWLELSTLHLADMDYAKAAYCMEELLLAQVLSSLLSTSTYLLVPTALECT